MYGQIESGAATSDLSKSSSRAPEKDKSSELPFIFYRFDFFSIRFIIYDNDNIRSIESKLTTFINSY